MQLRGENQADDGCKKQENTDLIHSRAERLLNLCRILFFQGFNGNNGFFGGEFGAEKECPERNDKENRPLGNGKVDRTDAYAGEAIGLHEAGELTGYLNGSCQRKDAAAGHADDHDREHILGTAVAGLVAQSSQQRADDRIDDHGACDEVGEQNSQKNITEVRHFKASTGQLHNTVAHIANQ